MTNQEKESQFFSMCSIAASKYGLELKIDPETRNIDLIGDVDRRNVVACAVELSELAENWPELL